MTRSAIVIVTAAILACAAPAGAGWIVGPDWKEGNGGSGDAGSFPSSAQIPVTGLPFPADLRTISGDLSLFLVGPPDQQDVYAIYINDPLAFMATTDSGVDLLASTTFNSQLFLFDAAGLPVIANDGVGDGATVMLPTFALIPGVYYIAVSVFNSDPLDASATLLFPDLVGPQVLPTSPNPPTSWTTSPISGGSYTIALRGTVFVPAPGAPLFVGLAALLAGRTRRRA